MPATRSAESLRVVIVGGGIAGLSASWYLEKRAAAHDVALEPIVLEQSGRWGGKVLTEVVDGYGDTPFVIEAGPDSFLTQKPWALELARELGLEPRLIGTNDDKRTVSVLNKGEPTALPDGLLLIVPTKFAPFARSPLLSPLGKLRMALELIVPARKDDEDETLADFTRRRLGNEALDKVAEPLLSGIYNAEADRQSIMATLPRFRVMEREHGSLIRGMMKARRERATVAQRPGGRMTSAFMSFYDGSAELIDRLVALSQADLRLDTSVETVRRLETGRYRVVLGDGSEVEADVVILATPAFTSAALVKDLSPSAADLLSGIRYVSTGTISLAFDEGDVPPRLNGFGLVIPGSEGRPINAVTVSSTKFDHRAPGGMVLMRVFFGGSRSPDTMQLPDEALLRTVRGELSSILAIEAEPVFHRTYRWCNANPQYDLGHLERVGAIEAALPDGLYVTGSPYRGVGMPDCVHQSQQVADRVLNEFLDG